MGSFRKRQAIFIGLFSLFVANVNAAEPQAETCEQIRAQMKAQTGVLAAPDTHLLAKIGANSACRFTSAEAYRAAYGDKPLPKDDPSARHRKQHEDNDD